MGPQSQQALATETSSHSLSRLQHWTRAPAISNRLSIDSKAT